MLSQIRQNKLRHCQGISNSARDASAHEEYTIKIGQRPNFLFLFPDQHRRDWFGDNPVLPLRTPNIDRLARRGVRFTRAYTPSPLCSPARACLATGRAYERCGVRNNGQNTPLSLPTYYRYLRDSGYEVAGVGKFDLHKPDMDWGLDGRNLVREYGFTDGIDNEGKGDAIKSYRKNGFRPKGPYMQFLTGLGLLQKHFGMYQPHLDKPGWLNFPAVTELPDDAYCDNWVGDNGIRFLRAFPRGKPWHLAVNFVGPHMPFDVTPDMRRHWENAAIPDPHDNNKPDQEIIRAHCPNYASMTGNELNRDAIHTRRQNYAAIIENIDRLVGEIISVVEERGERDRTIIVYTSDHGEMLGDHGRWGKSVWYEPSVGIPLIIAGPGIRSGITSDAFVFLHDLAATFLDYAGAESLPETDAVTLRPLLEGKRTTRRSHIISGLNDWRMVFDGRHKLVAGARQLVILHDLESDPMEEENVAPHYPDIVARLARFIRS